ncbi:unnamed protein product [Cochlearia groenlandica]
MWNQKPSFRFKIDNFTNKETNISSHVFVGDGCEWYISVHQKRESFCNDHLGLYLYVGNRKSLRCGWRRNAKYYFVVSNQSDKELYKSSMGDSCFCSETRAWGFRKTLPQSKFEEKGFLEKDTLIIEVYINVLEAFDGEDNDVDDISGFQVFASHVSSLGKKFAEHVAKTEYKNVLNKTCNKLSQVAQVGFNRLKSKIDEVSLKMKKPCDVVVDESLVQELEERIKNLELMEVDLKLDCLKLEIEEVYLEKKKVQELEESVKNLEIMVLDLKVELNKGKGQIFW